jgi:hypothetical protein
MDGQTGHRGSILLFSPASRLDLGPTETSIASVPAAVSDAEEWRWSQPHLSQSLKDEAIKFE